MSDKNYRIKDYMTHKLFGTSLQTYPPPQLIDLKTVYSYVIEVVDSESESWFAR